MGISLFNTGDIMPNWIICNTIDTGCVATHAVGLNGFTRIYQNLFDNYKYDINIEGKIQNQGVLGKPALNCFSDYMAHVLDIRVPSILNTFKYYIDKSIDSTNCEYPNNIGGLQHYIIAKTGRPIGLSHCPTPPENIIGEEDEYTYTLGNFVDNQRIASIAYSDYIGRPDTTKENIYYLALNESYRIFGKLLNQSIREGDFDLADTLLQIEGSMESKRLRFGLMMRQEKYSEATTFLLLLTATTREDSLFRQVQQINIKFLTDTTGMKISSIDSVKLEEAIADGGRNAGYAVAILRLVKDIDPPTPINCADVTITGPGGPGGPGGHRFGVENNTSLSNKVDFSAFPNPANESLTIMIKSLDNRGYNIKIFDMHGKLSYIVNNVMDANYVINTSNLFPGAYKVLLLDLDDHLISGKTIFIHR